MFPLHLLRGFPRSPQASTPKNAPPHTANRGRPRIRERSGQASGKGEKTQALQGDPNQNLSPRDVCCVGFEAHWFVISPIKPNVKQVMCVNWLSYVPKFGGFGKCCSWTWNGKGFGIFNCSWNGGIAAMASPVPFCGKFLSGDCHMTKKKTSHVQGNQKQIQQIPTHGIPMEPKTSWVDGRSAGGERPHFHQRRVEARQVAPGRPLWPGFPRDLPCRTQSPGASPSWDAMGLMGTTPETCWIMRNPNNK